MAFTPEDERRFIERWSGVREDVAAVDRRLAVLPVRVRLEVLRRANAGEDLLGLLDGAESGGVSVPARKVGGDG